MAKYVPESLPANPTMEQLVEFLQREHARIAEAAADRDIPVLSVPPSKPYEYMLVNADGENWNPGYGKGPYIYISGKWMYLGQIAPGQEPPEEEPPPPPPPEDEEPPPPPPPAGTPHFLQTFEVIEKGMDGSLPRLWLDRGIQERTNNFYRYQIQSADMNTRCQQMNQGRHGSKGILLRTSGADTGISGSGTNERCDLNPSYHLTPASGDIWFSHSIWLPPTFLFAPHSTGATRVNGAWWHIIWQFHDQSGQPPFPIEIMTDPQSNESVHPFYPTFRVRINAGSPKSEQLRQHLRNDERVEAGHWYDFVWWFQLTTANTGRCKLWLHRDDDGAVANKEIDYTGPTYAGNGIAPKPANYHRYAPGAGNWTEVGHDRIIWGNAEADLDLAQLGFTLEP